jgi:hypothetical protein
MRATVAEPQVRGREAQDERSGRQICDHRNTNWQRGRVRAASVLANTKPKPHQGASGRARWRAETVQVLTRGDLCLETGGEVSRGRSSQDACRKAGRAKGRRKRRNRAENQGRKEKSRDLGTRQLRSPSPSRTKANGCSPDNQRKGLVTGLACPASEEFRCFQPPDAENGTSGGVGGVTGAIPSSRPDLSNLATRENSCPQAAAPWLRSNCIVTAEANSVHRMTDIRRFFR